MTELPKKTSRLQIQPMAIIWQEDMPIIGYKPKCMKDRE
jgi:hypothetical protein